MYSKNVHENEQMFANSKNVHEFFRNVRELKKKFIDSKKMHAFQNCSFKTK